MMGSGIFDSIMNKNGIISEKVVNEILTLAVENGRVRFFDTAEGYGGGTSEERLGRFLKERRREKEGEDEVWLFLLLLIFFFIMLLF